MKNNLIPNNLSKLIEQLKYKFVISPRHKRIFNEIYKDINGELLSKKDRGNVIADDLSLVYGEVVFRSFTDLLNIVDLKDKGVFYDLGSGTGKGVIAAALSQKFSKCIGLEILPSLHQASIKAYEHLQNYQITNVDRIEFINNDFFTQNIGLADAIFINATGFFGEIYELLVDKLTEAKKGAKIIIVSKSIKNTNFTLEYQDLVMMSWGWARTFIYRKN